MTEHILWESYQAGVIVKDIMLFYSFLRFWVFSGTISLPLSNGKSSNRIVSASLASIVMNKYLGN